MPPRPIKMPLLLFLLLSRNLTPSSQYAFQWTLPHPQIPATPQLRVSNQSKQAKDPSQPLQSSRQPHLHLVSTTALTQSHVYMPLYITPQIEIWPPQSLVRPEPRLHHRPRTYQMRPPITGRIHTSPPQSSLSSSLTSHAPLNEHTDTRSSLCFLSITPHTTSPCTYTARYLSTRAKTQSIRTYSQHSGYPLEPQPSPTRHTANDSNIRSSPCLRRF